MNIVFFGNTKYSLIDAQVLHKAFNLTAVVTIPDRPGKRNEITQSPVKTFALTHTIPVIEATKITDEIIAQIRAFQPDFLVVADYRLLLPRKLLDIPKFAPLNIHHSLLPKYRGSSPVSTALLHGERKTGVTIIKMNDALDDGDILAQKEYAIQPEDTAESLLTILNQIGAQAAIDVINHFQEITPIHQDNSQATFTTYMTKEDGYIDINNPPPFETLHNMIRAYYPWPGVWTRLRLHYGGQAKEKIVKLLPINLSSLRTSSQTGVAISQKNNLCLIQIEGKKPQTIKDFLNGYPDMKEFLEKLNVLRG